MISVIIPIYNTGQYLEKCLLSVINQSFKDIEIICINDCSTDNSLQILKKINSIDKRIKIISLYKNSGLSVARNIGLENALGDYICFVDSDDELEIEALEKMWSVFNNNPDIDIVVGNINVVYYNNDLKNLYKDYFAVKYKKTIKINDDIIKNFYVCAWGKLYKRSVIDRINLRFPENLYFEDNYWHWCYLTSSNFVYFLNSVVYNYHIRNNSIMDETFNKKEGRAIHYLYIADNICNFFYKNNTLNLYKNSILYVIEQMFFNSINHCLQYEKALCAYTCASILIKYKINSSRSILLTKIKEGELDFLYGNNIEQNNKEFIYFLRIKNIYETIIPENSIRRKILIKLSRKIYKFILTKFYRS